MSPRKEVKPDRYTWGWMHAGGVPASLHVAFVSKQPTVDLCDGVPDERVGVVEAFADHAKLVTGNRPGEVRSGPWKEWGAWVLRDSNAAHGDRSNAIPRLIAHHALGRPPSSKQIAAVAKLCRDGDVFSVDRAAVDAALSSSTTQEAML